MTNNNCNEICAMLTNDYYKKRCLNNQRCLNSCKYNFYRNCTRVNTKCDCNDNCRIESQYFCSDNPRLYKQCNEQMYSDCINQKCNSVNLDGNENEYVNEEYKKREDEEYKKREDEVEVETTKFSTKGSSLSYILSIVILLSIFSLIIYKLFFAKNL